MRLAHAVTLTSLLALGCGGAAGTPCSGGDGYPVDGFTTNAAVELQLRARLVALNARMKAAEDDLTLRPTAAELDALFRAGSPSLQSITAAPFATRLAVVFADFELAAGNTWTPVDPPSGPGGKLGAYLFSARGVDLRQAMEKGLFGAAHYHEAVRLMQGDVTAAAVDRLVALYGASPAFSMDDEATGTPDVHSAVYARRRTNPRATTPGPYAALKRAFIDARAAAGRGEACRAARDAALGTIRAEWERALVATALFYFADAATKLEKPNPSAVDRGAALHGYTEGVAFLQGLRAVPEAARRMTDAQLDQVLETVRSPWSGSPTAHTLLTDSAGQVGRLAEAVGQLQAAWSFTADEVANFKVNY
jgi:hypothetical protein